VQCPSLPFPPTLPISQSKITKRMNKLKVVSKRKSSSTSAAAAVPSLVLGLLAAISGSTHHGAAEATTLMQNVCGTDYNNALQCGAPCPGVRCSLTLNLSLSPPLLPPQTHTHSLTHSFYSPLTLSLAHTHTPGMNNCTFHVRAHREKTRNVPPVNGVLSISIVP
jgi:hypothetical protein